MCIKAAETSIGFLLSSLLRLAEIKPYQVSKRVAVIREGNAVSVKRDFPIYLRKA